MDESYFKHVFTRLRLKGYRVAPGLTEDQLVAAEGVLGCRFPPDLRALLSLGLPHSGRWGFPDWRRPENLAQQLGHPLEGILFDVEHNDFWMSEWGERPSQMRTAIEIADQQVRQAPRLIPVFGHRYLPAKPLEERNPVFSVMQTDIIVYGNDLADYLAAEFRIPRPRPAPAEPREIPFWSRFVELNA